MACYDETYVKRKEGDTGNFEIDSKNPIVIKLKNRPEGKELDSDYVWCIIDLIERDKQIKATIYKDPNENEYKNQDYEAEAEADAEDKDEDEVEVEAEDEDENEDEGVCIDENNKDPDYLLFLENLTEHGKSYKLKISNNDEEPVFVYYEEERSLDWHGDDLQMCTDNSGDAVIVSEDTPIKQKAKRKVNETNGGIEIRTKKEVSRRKKSKDRKSIPQGTTVDSANRMCFDGPCIKVKCEEESFENEEMVTTSSGSDVVILDNVQNWSEVKSKQPVKNEPSLKEKLMKILKVPYSEKEYQELSEYVEQERPVLQLKPLRDGRSRSCAKAGFNKTMLNYAPYKFRSMLKAAQNELPKALNLLRMFRFWLEHVPNDDAFEPWNDEDILKVRPRNRRML